MNFGKGGQNIVQAGSSTSNVFRGTGGNILGAFLGTKLRRQERDYHRTKDEESRMRINKANVMDKAGADVFKALVLPGAAAHGATQAYAIANQTLGEDHPDVIAGKRQANEQLHPEMARQVNKYGFDTGWRPSKTPPSVSQEELRADRLRNSDENSRGKGEEFIPSVDNPDAGTVARFKNGEIIRKEITTSDVEGKKNKTQRVPKSMRDTGGSTAPTDRTWTSEEKSALESERPRTANLNAGISEGTGGNK